VKVFPQPGQRPRRIPIQSWCSSWACLRRRPWPMIESHSQIGHRRKMTSAQLAAHSASSLCAGVESGINEIVLVGALPRLDLPRSRPDAELLPPEGKSNWKRITLFAYCFYGCDSQDWPVINGNPEVISSPAGLVPTKRACVYEYRVNSRVVG
jgi:hypothetical protein